MAMSENSIKVVEFLKQNHGKNMTSTDVAEALGMSKSTVNGVFTALQKKGYGMRVDATVEGTTEISALAVTDEGIACDKAEMSDTIKGIFEYLTANRGVIVTLDDMAAALNADKRAVNGSYNSLVRKGYATRTPVTVKADVAVKFLVLTEAGLALDTANPEA
jgi:DNA-binding IclR family transcriptional regulator